MSRGRMLQDYDHTCHLLVPLEHLTYMLQCIFAGENAPEPEAPKPFAIHPLRDLDNDGLTEEERKKHEEAKVLAAKLGQMRFAQSKEERLAAFKAAHGIDPRDQ